VRAEGVGVVAALQDSRLDGFIAAGTDWVSPSAAATELMVPVAGSSASDGQGTLSLLAPDGADATITLVTQDGVQPWLGDEALSLEAGVATDLEIPMTGLVAVRIEATASVVAGVRIAVARPAPLDANDSAFDHAWTGAQDAMESRQRAVVVPEGTVRLVVASAAGGTFAADVDAGDAPAPVEVAEGAVAVVDLDVAPGTVLSSAQPMAWALLVQDDDAGFLTTVEPVVTELQERVAQVAVGSYVPVP
jgi:hypothetical protein